MVLLDWIKDRFEGEDPKPTAKPAAKPAPSADTYRAQVEKSSPLPQPSLFPQPSSPFSSKTAPEWTKPAAEKQQYGPWAAPTAPSDGVRELLNKQNWKLPEQGKRADMPDSAFQEDGFKDLRSHDYRVSNEEWSRLQELYDSPAAASWGYTPPEIGTVSVDQNVPLMQLGEMESAALTWEAYEALSKDQRAAVDFNSLLVGAREKDLGMSVYMNDADRAEYDKKVVKLFGAGRGSDTLAPATVNLLSELDMSLVGQDIDEYLSLERAVDTTELSDFKFSTEQVKTMDVMLNGTAPTYEQTRDVKNLRALDTAAIQQAQEVIKTAFTNPEAVALNLDTLVGQVNIGQPPLGWGTASTTWKRPEDAALNQWFKDAAYALGTQDTSAMPAGTDPTSFLLEELTKQPGYGPNTQQEFLDYLTGISSMAGQYGSAEDQTMAALINKRLGG